MSSLALALCLLARAGIAQEEPAPKTLFLAATASFAAGNYTAAERQFLACRRAVGDNTAIDHNLGVTYLRLEELGRARAWLERARKLAPRDRETRDQLRALYSRLDQPVPPPPSWLHALWQGARDGLTYGEALALATLAGLAAALLVGLWLLGERRAVGWLAAVAVAAAAFTWSIALAKAAEQLGPQRAIVVGEGASLRGGPGEEFGEIARLSEGAEVWALAGPRLRLGAGAALRVVREEGGVWCEVRAAAGARGYIRRSLIEPI
jgi:tetratricopeptide (TPR) repeat protein